MAKMTRKEMFKELFNARTQMFLVDSVSAIEEQFDVACDCQSALFPMQCCSGRNWDCRNCYLTKMRADAVKRLKESQSQPEAVNVTVNGNVTINISINGKEA